MKLFNNNKIIFVLAIVLLVAVFPLLVMDINPYLVYIFSLIGIYIILCLSLNITIGYTGLLDLGFMAFYAIGAYTAAILSIKGV